MAYSAFEASSGDALDMVEGFCKQYTSSSAFVDGTTQPSLSEVETFLTTRYYVLQMTLGEAGYAIVPTDTEVVGVLQRLNAIGAALDVELTNPITGSGEANERFKVFERMWDDGLKSLRGSGLKTLGATRAYTNTLAAGGISISRKDVLRDDSDAVKPSFTRKMQENPNVAGSGSQTSTGRSDL